MSLASPMPGTAAVRGPAAALSAPVPDRFERLDLGDGWSARVVVGPRQLATATGTHNAVLTTAHWRDWLSDPLKWARQADRRDCMKTSSTTTVCRVRLPLENGQCVDAVCKRSRSRKLRRRLLSVVRTSRPLRTWRRAHTLLARQIATAHPLAVVEQRRFGLLVDSVIFTEYLHHTVDLEGLLTTHMRGVDNKRAYAIKAQVGDVLIGFFLRLQAAGLYHRDFKALNVLVQWDRAAGQPPRICLVDLDGLKRSWLVGDAGWKHMLMRLNVSVDPFRRVSLTDRVRLLQAFIRRAGVSTPWKRLWHELAALSEHKRRVLDRHQARAFRKYGRF